MNYYLDTEFIEDFRPSFNFIGKSRHFIDLISIGLVCEDGREYYAISKDFNLKFAWNRYDVKQDTGFGSEPYREYWLRDNVLQKLHRELYKRLSAMDNGFHDLSLFKFTYKNLKRLIRIFGKSNKQIALEIQLFTRGVHLPTSKEAAAHLLKYNVNGDSPWYTENPPVFYAYYADYDWVLFCSLFGRMIDLPQGYPMYCRDLKQIQDDDMLAWAPNGNQNNPDLYKCYKNLEGYPNQIDEHNALADAKWNQKLHQFLKMRGNCLYSAKQQQNETY